MKSKEKRLILIGIIFVFILVGYFLLQVLNKSQKSGNGQKQVDLCAFLDEHACQENENCYPSYKQKGPNRDKFGTPLLNFYFDKCLPLTKEEIEQIQGEKKDCEAKGGYWMETYGNPKGFCSLPEE